MKNKMTKLICSGIILGTITGCGLSSNKNLDNNSKLETKGKCTATECIQKINPENTVEEINKIIGFKGEMTSEEYNKYYWELSEDSSIEVTYYSSDKGTIKAEFDKKIVANSKVDFSRYDELKPKISEGITYDEFIKYIGNVDGILIEKSSYSKKYVWVAEDGRSYLNGTFSISTGKCTFVSGMIY